MAGNPFDGPNHRLKQTGTAVLVLRASRSFQASPGA